ncbi:hypothetical protein D3C71_1474910 [compost metagenome]
MRQLGWLATGHIGHRATRDEPHHQLDALAARLAHIVDVRDAGSGLGVVDELVEEGVVKLFVDEAGAGALQLVAHATRAPDVHVQVFVIALHGLADGLAQVVAAAAAGHRVLHHVDGERDHRAGPGALRRVLFAKHQRQGHGQAVVHGHLVDDGEVKVLLDDRLRNVRGQVRMTNDLGHGARAKALIGHFIFGSGADGERGDQVQAEGRGVVVVDQEDHVGLVVLDPLLAKVIAREHGLPVVLVGLAQVHSRANGWHMRCEHGGGDFGHRQIPFLPALPCGWRCAWASPSSPT